MRDNGREDFITNAVKSVVTPGSSVVTRSLSAIDEIWVGFRDARKIKRENERLKDIARGAEQYAETLERYKNELRDLRRMLELPMPDDREKVFARVVGYAPMQNHLTLNVGAKQGIKPYMPVIAADGLIGVIETVSQGRSQVLLLSSPTIRVASKTLGTPNVPGMVRGETTGRLLMEIYDPGEVHTGKTVVTSGYSETIPEGILIGTVIASMDDPRFGARRLRILPFVHMGDLNEVFVLK
ncbi:MAG: rod shape-determining protein MreC [Armatimonadetes bacterium]|nr:rod shape-determining protein MreC [Armatimonadota bacterium]